MSQDEQAHEAQKIQNDLFKKILNLAPKFNVKVAINQDNLEISGDTEDIKRFCVTVGIEIGLGEINE